MQHQALLEDYLKQLHLSSFIDNYQAYAADAARTELPSSLQIASFRRRSACDGMRGSSSVVG